MDKLEKKFGKYAIRNLTLALIIGYALGYVITFVDNLRDTDFLSFLMLDPWKIIHGEVWRIFTWLIVPPNESNILFVLLMLWCCYSIGTVLERTWGTFRYNVYIFGGILSTVIAAFAALLYIYLRYGLIGIALYENVGIWAVFSTYYINISIYLGFAMTYPDNMVRFMFLIPVRMKWLGIIDLVYMGYLLVAGNEIMRFAVAAALINIIIFYLINIRKFSVRNARRKAKFNKAYNSGRARNGEWQNTATYRNASSDEGVKMRNPGQARHKCSICGQTEISNPSLEFRYCSKCVGNYEYCQEHLFTHSHKN